MFQALLAHLQEELHKQQLVYCMCIVGCQLAADVDIEEQACK
jgi:hypothetical protein